MEIDSVASHDLHVPIILPPVDEDVDLNFWFNRFGRFVQLNNKRVTANEFIDMMMNSSVKRNDSSFSYIFNLLSQLYNSLPPYMKRQD